MYKLLLTLFGLCCFYSANAQPNWKSKGLLYHDKNITVEIEYAMGGDPCQADGTSSQYRYKITRLKIDKGFYINWRFDYFNCDHQLKTHANSLQITKKTKVGYITPADNEFLALRLANNFNDVKREKGLPEVTAYEPKSPTSLEPKLIAGKPSITKGDTAQLTIVGGYLAAHTTWKWYENGCNGKAIGTGPSIAVHPGQTTTYAVRAEGESPAPCVLVTITVLNVSMGASAIEGISSICEGEKNVKLTVSGGKLSDGAKWVWYQDYCEGSPIGEGYSIYVSPVKTTSYYVRAEGTGGNTNCQLHVLAVAERSVAARSIDGAETASYGESFTLTVHGGKLAPDAKWVWYAVAANKINKLLLGTGSSFTVASAYADQTYYVRAEGACYSSAFTAKTVRLTDRKKPVPSQAASAKLNTFFINGGVVANDPGKLNGLKNYVATLGGGKNNGWFIRAKISGDQSKAQYEAAGTQITNYDRPGYYQYNSETASKRAAYTGGVYLGGKNLAAYIGAGYGTRELFYGIDQYQYDDPFLSGSAWVKNTSRSYSGAEVEGGLILRVGFFNMMGGVSTIQGKYTDYNLGIGFNF